jgi:hypothetical protein
LDFIWHDEEILHLSFNRSTQPRRILLVSALLAGAACLLPGAEKLSVDDLVTKHLESIGTQEARSAVKSTVAQGTVAFNERISGIVHMDGRALLLSQGAKLKCAFQFSNPQYRGEQLVFDGKNVQVATIDQQSRSALGNFLANNPEIFQEGLLGGTLSMSWPLLDVKASGAKLKSESLKKVEGRELYELTYIPKKQAGVGELIIHFYFEQDTFRHVMTVYRLTSATMDGIAGDAQASDAGTRTTTVTELFSDFLAIDGVTLPSSWEIRLLVEPSAKPQEFQWKVAFNSIAHNKLGQQ